MGDIANTLEIRPRLVAVALNSVPNDTLWFPWMDKDKELKVSDLRDGGSTIDYRHPDGKEYLIQLTNIRAKDGLRNMKTVDIPLGRPETIDKATIPARNFDGAVPIPIQYDARLSTLETREHAFSVGFSQSFTSTFTFQEGGEAASFKAVQAFELAIGSSQDTTDTEGQQTGEDRGAGITPECPPGYDIDFYLERTSQKTKTRVTGIGDVDFGIRIGKHWDGHWNGRRGEGGKRYSRWVSWDSWDEFMSVLKGEGRRDLDMAEWFWTHPAPAWLIKKLEKPLDLPFDHTGAEFDGATQLTVGQTVLRGPKYESQRLVIEDQLVG